MDPLESLLAQVDNLPTLPDVHLRIVHELGDPDCELHALPELIALDAVLAGRVIRLANSAVFGAVERTTSLVEAIQRLGTRDTRNLVLTASIVDIVAPTSSVLNPREFWSLGLASALCARQLARDLGLGDADEAYLGGLVHSLGEALLALYFPDRFTRAVEEARATRCTLLESIWSEFGFTHPVLCARVLEKWNFPRAVVEGVEYQLDPGEAPHHGLLASIILVADRTCRELGFGLPDPGTPERSWLGELPPDAAERLLDGGYADLDDYLTEQKQHLEDVSRLVTAVFSGR